MNYKDKQKKIISPLVANSLPLSIKKDYDSSVLSSTGRSIFSDFIQAYYEYVEREVDANINDFKNVSLNTFKNKSIVSLGSQSGGPYNILNRLPSLRDFDTTMQSLKVHIRNEYLKNIPENIEGNLNNLMRLIRKVYQSKGTEIAYKTLFRYIWNSSVKLTDTATEIFRSSDNQYKIEKVMRVKLIGGIDGTTQSNLYLFKDNFVVGKDSEAKVLVNGVTTFTSGTTVITELSIDEGTLDGIFLPTEQVYAQAQSGTDVLNLGTIVTVRAQIVPGISKVSLVNRGMGYVPGDVLTFHSSTGSDAVAKVKNVTAGPVELLVKTTSGSGYTSDPDVGQRLSFSSMYIDVYTEIVSGVLDNAFDLTMNTGGTGDFTVGDTFINGVGASSFTASGIITSWNSSTRVLGVTDVRGYFVIAIPITANQASWTLNSHTTASGATGEWKSSDIYNFIQHDDYNILTSATIGSDGTIGTTKATAEVLVKAYPMGVISEVSNGQAPNIWRLFVDEITGTFSVGDYCRIGDSSTYSIGKIVNMHKYQSKPHGKYTLSGNVLDDTVLIDGGAGFKIAPQPYIHWDTLTGNATTHANIIGYGSNLGSVKEIDIIDPGVDYLDTDTVTFPGKVIANVDQGTTIFTMVLMYNGESKGLTNAAATGIITTSALVKKSSNFKDNIGFMDGTQRLADYNSYQPFSYMLETAVHPDMFKELVDTVLHPAGMKMITKYVIESKQTPIVTAKQDIS